MRHAAIELHVELYVESRWTVTYKHTQIIVAFNIIDISKNNGCVQK